MGLNAHPRFQSRQSTLPGRAAWLLLFCCASPPAPKARAQALRLPVKAPGGAVAPHILRSRRFLGGRTLSGNFAAARAMDAAREQQAAMLAARALQLQGSSLAPSRLPSQAYSQLQSNAQIVTGLNTAWQPVGPSQVAGTAYGKVTGRVTSIALDPSDASGNTVYLGTTGGGVWKSVNAAGPPAGVTFTPLTDTLPVFSANAGTSIIPSLSIGAVSVQPGAAGTGVVLAGTGDPNDATDSFYGNGILRSADKGLTWTLIRQSEDGASGPHSFLGLGFSGFAWSSVSPDTVVAAVSQAAEGTLVNAPDAVNSVMGLYYSTDGGTTWHMATLMDGGQTVQHPQTTGLNHGGNAVTSVVWNPVRQRFYAAVRYHGYYESPDGVTWTRLAHQPGNGLTTVACPANPDSTGSLSCPIFRGALAVQPATGDTFALTVDGGNLDQGLWQDACGLSGSNCLSSTVTFASQLPSTPLEAGSGSAVIPQADYNLALAAVPSGSDTLLYVGTIDLYRCSLADGCLLRNTTNAINGCSAPAMVAPAQHAIATLTNSALLYLGNDGGLWRSTDGVDQQSTPCSADDAAHFQNLNGGLGSLAEITSFAQHPTDPETLLAGLGANGTAATSTASAAAPWVQLAAGEGGNVAIDASDPQLWYLSTGAGVSVRQCSSGAGCTAMDFAGTPTIGAAQTANDASLIDAPWLLDPALSSDILLGTCRVWRGPAAGGASWSSSNAISKLFGGPQNAACGSSNSMIRSLSAAGQASGATAAQNAGSRILYAGMAGTLDGGGSVGGHLFSTTAADTAGSATAWTDLGIFNPGGFDISSVTADPHDATGKTVYVTVMGFAGNGVNASHLFRSTDAGAHWTNISGNLPNAPANSVVVDPNDANTVYVALDTGVYVTTQVATCADSGVNCWSIYGGNLPNAPVVQLAAAAGLPTGDGRTGELRAATYGRGIWQIPLLTALSSVQAVISLHPAALAFGMQAVSTASAPQTVTVTNTGAAPLSISQVAATGDFNEADDCTSAAIASNQSCAIEVRFLPSATGGRTGLLTVYGNVAGGQATAALTGTASPAAAVVLNPVAVVFPSTAVNATSAAQNITISNTGADTVTLQTPMVVGAGFSISANTCGATLLASTGCTVAVTFTPTASGAHTGMLTVTDSVGTQTASLTGTGVLPATDALSPLALAFAPQQLTTASASQQIVLTNTGDTALTLIAAEIASGDFSVTNACGNSLNPHSACALNVQFQPQSIGRATGLLTVSDEYRSQSVALSGTGVAPPGVSLSPIYTLNFPTTGVGQTALPQTVTLTNNGGLPLDFEGTALTGDFAILAGSDTCGATLAPANACTFEVVFAPTAAGARSGALTVTDSAPNSPQTLRLTGDAIDFALSPDGDTTVAIASGQNAVFPLLFTPSPTLHGTATFACAGVPLNAACNITPGSISLDATATVSVVVETGVSGVALATTNAPAQHRPALWLAVLLPLGLLALGRRRLPRLTGFAILCCLLLPTGCGAGRQLPSSGSTGGPPAQVLVTPSGTYPIVVSATSAGLTRTIHLTLIVK